MRRPLSCFFFVVLALALVPAVARAHQPSDSHLRLERIDDGLHGRWEIALRDLEYAVGLDADGDHAITWGELRARQAEVTDYALARLEIAAGDASCRSSAPGLLVSRRADTAFAVLELAIDCPRHTATLELAYKLFFDLDPNHRGLITIVRDGRVETAVLAPDRATLTVGSGPTPWTASFASFWREGVWHIWIGFDHVLFLLTLLLPAVLCRRPGGGWAPASSVRGVVSEVAGVVTAFTIAHSLTLALAMLGWVALPTRLVESAIAVTVVLAALHNLRPVIGSRRWVMAFALGLVHGFGFAGVLVDLGLPAGALASALVGFNLGVECGQLVIVAAFLPLAYAARRTAVYRGPVLRYASLAVAALALVWCFERGLGLSLLPL